MHVWLTDITHSKMETHGWRRRFRFPGYDGALPKALRSLRGRSKYQQKISKPPSDGGLFELLATVAGQVLQESNLNEEKAKKQIGVPKDRENTTTDSEDVSQTDHGFVQQRQSNIVGKPAGCWYKSKDVVPVVDITSKAFGKTVKNNNYNEELGFEGVDVGETLSDPCTDMPPVDSKKDSNKVDSSEKGSIIVDDVLACRSLKARYNGPKGIVSDFLAQSNLDVLVGSKNHAGTERGAHEEGSCISMQHLSHQAKSPLPSFGSLEEDLTSVHTKPLVRQGKQAASEKHSDITRQKLVCVTAKDDDNNLSVSVTRKATSLQISPQKELKEELRHGEVRMETSTTGCKRKFFPTNGTDSSIGSSPTRNNKAPWRRAKNNLRESHVKVNITSFIVPDLCIDLPKTATVANLKRAVMDAAINVLGGGLHVRVLHQGKKVHDESTTLVQMGISNCERLDSLAFMLEPDLLADTNLHMKDPLLGLPNASNESAAWYPVFSLSKDRCENNGGTMKGESCGYAVTDIAQNLATQGETNMTMEQGRGVEPHQYIPGEAPVPLCGPLILHPGTKVMDIVLAQQKFQGTNCSKRRVRRPFTVLEVAALVQAVEFLGTGRWREVKQQAFDHARHRTYVDLKDKWKTLVHTAHIAPHQRRGEPVPQELLDRVLKAHTYWAAQHTKQQAVLRNVAPNS